jgi:tetratricopeptide (TPR) repeat protein
MWKWSADIWRKASQRLTLLGIVQLITLTLMLASLIAAVLWLHHQTADYFIPLPSYLQSIKVALPPAAIFVATYAIAFLGGIAIGDVPKTALSFARNRFFQSFGMMSAASAVMLALCAYSIYALVFTTAPAYEKFVRLLMNGSSDNLQLAKENIEAFRATNPDLATKFGKVVEVFAERSSVNAGVKQLSGERARTFVRALEVTGDDDWDRHPLRRHALAEAYLLFGQSFEQAGRIASALAPGDRNPFQVAIELYESVAAANEPLAPGILRSSALNNVGNAYYYLHDPQRALVAWRNAMRTGEGRNNLSSWGNIVAALILSGKPEEAIDEGERARAWAEKTGRAFVDTYQYAGILGNTGFARLQLSKFDDALKDFAAAHAFREDDLTRQNLALALIVSGRHTDAQKVLRQIAPPVDGAFASGANPKIASCVYLIWALALKDAPIADRAANLLSFLGERHSAEEMRAFDAVRMAQLQRRASEALPRSADPCASISQIEAIAALLRT